MKKIMRQTLSLLLAVIMLVPCSDSVMAKASNTEDKNGNLVADMQTGGVINYPGTNIRNGKDIYYTINRSPYNGIYKINKKATTIKRIFKKKGGIAHMSHYGKWMYFILDKDGGVNGSALGSNSWLCKVKLNGTGFKQICRSDNCMIRDNMLYYQKTKQGYEDEGDLCKSDIDTGKIGILNLKTGKKSTFSGGNMHLKAVEKNKIYYYTDNNSLYSMNANGNNRKKLTEEKDVYAKYIYNNSLYWINGNQLYKKAFKTKETKKLCVIKNLPEEGIVDIKKDEIYVLVGKHPKQNLYSVSINSGETKCIMKSSGFCCKIYGNVVVGSRYLAKEYRGKNNRIYNTDLYSYNLKTKKRVRLLGWFEQ